MLPGSLVIECALLGSLVLESVLLGSHVIERLSLAPWFYRVLSLSCPRGFSTRSPNSLAQGGGLGQG